MATVDDLPLSPVCTVPAGGCPADGADNRLGIVGGLSVLSPSSTAGVNSFELLGGSGGDSEGIELQPVESSCASREMG